MKSWGPYARIIVEADLVAKRIDEATKKAPHLSELYELGIKWKLSRYPQSGTKVPDSDYYIAKSHTWAPGGVPYYNSSI